MKAPPIDYGVTANRLEKYRTTTQKYAPSCGLNTFICKKCKERRLTEGRKMVTPGHAKDGWLCSECHAKRIAK